MLIDIWNIRLAWKSCRGQNSNLFWLTVSDEEKKFYKIDKTPGADIIKLFTYVIYEFSQ